MKRKAAGVLAKGLGACDARAVLRGGSPDLLCLAKVRALFAKLWARAERKGGCATTNDQLTIEGRVDAHQSDLQARLGVSGAPSRCTSLKFRDAGRRGACRLLCSAKAAKSGVSTSDAAIVRCTARCSSKLFVVFGRAEARHDCHTIGDATAIDSALGAFADCITSLLGVNGSTPCAGGGTTTTNVPGSTSTSTTMGAPTSTTMGGGSTTTTVTTSTTTTSVPAVTQCCIQSSVGGAFLCVPESSAVRPGPVSDHDEHPDHDDEQHQHGDAPPVRRGRSGLPGLLPARRDLLG